MSDVKARFYAAAVFAGGSLAIGYVSGGWWLLAPIPVILTVALIYGQQAGWRWMRGLGLFAFWSLSAAGALLGIGMIWLAAAWVAALAAWELERYAERLDKFAHPDFAAQLSQRHDMRLLIVSLTGFVLAWAATGIQIGLSFGWAAGLALLALLGFGQVFGQLRRGGE